MISSVTWTLLVMKTTSLARHDGRRSWLTSHENGAHSSWSLHSLFFRKSPLTQLALFTYHEIFFTDSPTIKLSLTRHGITTHSSSFTCHGISTIMSRHSLVMKSSLTRHEVLHSFVMKSSLSLLEVLHSLFMKSFTHSSWSPSLTRHEVLHSLFMKSSHSSWMLPDAGAN